MKFERVSFQTHLHFLSFVNLFIHVAALIIHLIHTAMYICTARGAFLIYLSAFNEVYFGTRFPSSIYKTSRNRANVFRSRD